MMMMRGGRGGRGEVEGKEGRREVKLSVRLEDSRR
jgi:hypothetical protein